MMTKRIKKILALVLCGAMVLDGGMAVFADTVSSGDAMPVEIVGVEVNQQVEDTVSSGDVLLEETTASSGNVLVEDETVSSGNVLVEDKTVSSGNVLPEEIEEIIWSNDEITVKITADANVLEDVETFEVTPITEDDARYAQIAEQLEDVANADETSALGFYAYDIELQDAEKNEIKPEGEFKVTVEYTDMVIPAEVTAENVEVTDIALMHVEENEDGAAIVTEMNGILSEEANAVKSTVFTADSLEGFLIAWFGDTYITIDYADDDVTVQVTGKESVLQDVTGLSVNPIKEEHEQYALVAEKLDEKATEEGKEVLGFLAYDIKLISSDENGNEIETELSDELTLSIVHTETAVPENVVGVENVEVETTDVSTAEISVHAICWVKNIIEQLEYQDDTIKITVYAVEKGAIPAEATLKVTPIEKVEITDDMTEEEKAVAEEINNEYDLTEQKLTETVEQEKELSVAGFLAYDITFVNVQGEEIEPNGQVKVVMEYAKATLPEKMQETGVVVEDVTVMHLEEDEAGEIANVVDMNESNQLETIETTADKEVQKAEFATESFSIFTITWLESASIKAYCVDANRNHIGETEFEIKKIDVQQEVNIAKFITEDVVYKEKLPDYTFLIAYVAASANSGTRTEIQRLRYNEGAWQYSTEGEGDSWIAFGSRSLYFQFNTNENPARVPVTSSRENGIEINLYDYKVQSGGINSQGNMFYFHAGGGGSDRNDTDGVRTNFSNDNSVQFTSGWPQSVYQDYIRYNLGEDGYPILNSDFSTNKYNDNNRISSDKPLNYLFTGTTNGVTPYIGLDGLFQVDSKGYYYYDSELNHAELNGDTIDVYSKASGNFLPFNDYNAARGNENSRNLWFGMTIKTIFYQPVDGLISEEDMVFNFSGDDDVWVFVDGVKVLDIGGIHDRSEGSINFRSGVVSVSYPGSWGQGEFSGTTTIVECYTKAFYEKYPNATNAQYTKYMNEIFKKDGNGNYTTFIDYGGHEFMMFYFERGAGDSNCSIKFNLPTVEEGTVVVEKQLTNTDKEQYANVEFAFQVFAQKVKTTDANGVETYYDDQYVLLDSAVYEGTNKQIEFKDGEVIQHHNDDGSISEEAYDNVFYLKAGESAYFSGLQANRKYYVVELGVNAKEFDQVKINNVGYKEYNATQQASGIIHNVQTDSQEISKRPVVIYENNCSAYNLKELRITKAMKTGQTSDDSFTFKVLLEDKNGNLVPYVGAYYLQDAIGNYYYYSNGRLVNNGTTSRVCGNTVDGLISDVGVGYTASITQILSETDFKVTEVNTDGTEFSSEKYATPVKALAEGTYDPGTVKDENGTVISDGAIKLGVNAEVTITNSLNVEKQWELIKKSSSGNLYLAGAKFELKSTENVYYGESSEGGKVTWKTSEGQDAVIADGTYTMTETQAPAGYAVSGETWTIVIADGAPTSVISSKHSQINLTPTEKTEGEKKIEVYTTYFENEVLYELPSTGGPGMYFYLLSGIAMMLGAAYVWFRNRRKEMLY